MNMHAVILRSALVVCLVAPISLSQTTASDRSSGLEELERSGGALTLVEVSTDFNEAIGIDYYEPRNTLLVSVNYPSGQPGNFEEILADGTHVPFSGVSGLTNEIKIGTARTGDVGGFVAGDLFVGNGRDGEIVRITNGGNTVFNPWVSLPGSNNGLMRGSLHVDRTGVFDGDLIVTTTTGQVWRITFAGSPTLIAQVPTKLEGAESVPDDTTRYGPLAGTILSGSQSRRSVYSFGVDGSVTEFPLNIDVEDIDLIPANENFFGTDYANRRILGAQASEFDPYEGDILLVEESFSGSGMHRLYWDGNAVRTERFSLSGASEVPRQWEHVTFAPAGIVQIDELEPDLAVTEVDASGISGDWQSLQAGGLVRTTIENRGSADVSFGFQVVLFEDLTFNQQFDPGQDRILGSAVLPGLGAGDSAVVDVSVPSTQFLFRESLVYAFVDGTDIVAESREDNNYGHSGQRCDVEPVDSEFIPELEWAWTGSSVFSDWTHVSNTAFVADLNLDGQPEVAFVSGLLRGGPNDPGILRIVDGATGQELVANTDGAARLSYSGSIAIGDIDLDGFPEIVAPSDSSRSLIAFEHDGTFKWESSEVEFIAWGAVSITNLDAEGPPEIIIGRDVLNNDGTLRWRGTGGSGSSIPPAYAISYTADLDADGQAELVAGNTVYASDGSIVWQNTAVPDGLTATADIDGDELGEIVLIDTGRMYMLEHDGDLAWGPVDVNGNSGGPPTLADFDGDGEIEIGVAGRTQYAVYEADGSTAPIWAMPTIDASSERTGSSVFDFEGDGRAEVVYRDEQNLRVYDGATGEVLFQVPVISSTWHEYPVIADVDADGAAEIIVVSTGSTRGVRVYGDAGDGWVATRQIWNQHAYSITNVNEDGTIPDYAEPNWLFPPDAPYNSFRQNVLTSAPSQNATPDLTASFIRLLSQDGLTFVSARIGNAGAVNVGSGVSVSFYNGDPMAGGALLGTTATSFRLKPGDFEDVSIPVIAGLLPPDQQDLYVSADDFGSLIGTVRECDEANNIHNASTTVDSVDDVTLSLAIEYMNTTYNRDEQTLIVDARVQNIGRFPVDAPIRMVIDTLLDPSLRVVNPDGLTPDSKPYFEFVATSDAPPYLMPGDRSPVKRLLFFNPNQVPLQFERSFVALSNRAPIFVTIPPSAAVADRPFEYRVVAKDPDGFDVAFQLDFGPDGMAVGDLDGVLTWAPDIDDIGSHGIQIRATDARGSSATQAFTLVVSDRVPNRPPSYTSAPPTRVATGGAYSYQAAATDPDGDVVTFSLLFGPTDSDLSDGFDDAFRVSPDGLAEWPFALPDDDAVREVGIRASDPNGGYADQIYPLTVGAVSGNPNAPSLYGTPGTLAEVGILYLYQPVASDPDGDVLAFSLTQAPTGMTIDANTGRVTWTPAVVGIESVVLEVTDNRGGRATQSWNIEIVPAGSVNQPPVVTSVPDTLAIIDELYSYQVIGSDPEGGTVEYELIGPPPGMQIDRTSGLVEWTPNTLGDFRVAVRVIDPEGASGSQVFDVRVEPPNNPPVITSSPILAATEGATYRYGVTAEDLDGHELDFGLLAAPSGMEINDRTGQITWVPATAGSDEVTVDVRDGRGGSDEQSFTVVVFEDTVPPSIEIVQQNSPAVINEPVYVAVQVADNVGVASRSLKIDGVPAELDALGQTNFQNSASGLVTLEASATDLNGNIATALRSVSVIDPSVSAPEIEVISPLPTDTLTTATPIVASITSDAGGGDVDWRVELRGVVPVRDPVTVFQGTGIIDGELGILDTSLLPNGTYEIAIVAENAVKVRRADYEINIDGSRKLGQFETASVDLELPLAGIPLVISRQYSSLDTSPGDFGNGWNLGVFVTVEDTVPEDGSSAYTSSTRVYVTKPNGQRVGFTFEPVSIGGLFATFLEPRFRPDPGVSDELELVEDTLVVQSGGIFFEVLFNEFNPSDFVLTTREGVKYTINESDGLRLIEDIAGNTITRTPTGLVSSLGVEVTIDRDTEGRITRILGPDTGDPSAPRYELNYEYDNIGNLVLVSDADGPNAQYAYDDPDFPSYLTCVMDDRGDPVVFNVFDDDGRIVTQCLGSANPSLATACFDYVFDPLSDVQTVFDGEGNRADLVLDDRGNLLQERFLVGGVPRDYFYSYDDRDNLTEYSTPGSASTVAIFDEEDNLIVETDAYGGVTQYFYNETNDLVQVVDPLGNVYEFGYDEDRRIVSSTDPLGGVTRFEYTDKGQLSAWEDATGNRWQYTYDGNGNPALGIDASGNEFSFQYSADGRLLRQVDRNGRATRYRYDGSGRVIEEIWETNPEQSFVFTYDGRGTLTSASGPQTNLTLDYWLTGVLRSIDYVGTPGMHNVQLLYGTFLGDDLVPGYDGNLSRVVLTDSFGGTLSHAYNDVQQIEEIVHRFPPLSGVGDDVTRRVVFGYDVADGLTAIARLGGADGLTPVATTFQTYPCEGCVDRTLAILHERASDNSTIGMFSREFDALGNTVVAGDHRGNSVMSYDGSGRLFARDYEDPGVSDEGFDYDPAGNRSASTYSSTYQYAYQVGQGGSRLLSDDRYEYLYDLEGNLVERVEILTNRRLTFEYDYRNRTTRVASWDGPALVDWEEYGYDALNRRIRLSTHQGTLYFVHDIADVILVLDESGTVIERRMPTLGNIDRVHARHTPNGTKWLLNDAIGSTRHVVDDFGGVVESWDYDSFGSILNGRKSLAPLDLGYTGRAPVLGGELLFLRARLYLPSTGRFVQEDPLPYYTYSYGLNNPFLYTDPTGLTEATEYSLLKRLQLGLSNCLRSSGGRVAFSTSVLGFALLGGGNPGPDFFDDVSEVYEIIGEDCIKKGKIPGPKSPRPTSWPGKGRPNFGFPKAPPGRPGGNGNPFPSSGGSGPWGSRYPRRR